ncbi:MAG: GDSL-type esterase/lipase family protein [Acutalibacteraceae bacterium]
MKKLLAALMSLTLVLSCCSIAASAAERSKYPVYTALGDSASSGFGLPDYAQYQSLVVYGKRIKGSYADLLAESLGCSKVYPYGVSGIRSSELRYLLDNTYHGDYILDRDMPTMSNGMITRDILKPKRSEYQKAVREADLITLDIGFDDIWVPTIACIYDIAADGRFDNADAGKTISEKVAEYGSAEVVLDNAFSYLRAWLSNPIKWAYYWDSWALTVTKWVADFSINYNAIVRAIYRLNPDVTVIALGCYNPCSGWDILPDDRAIEHLVQPYYDYVNAQKTAAEAEYRTYHYVELRNVDLINKKTTLPLYENLTLDGSGFNPHPTEKGHQQICDAILSELNTIS